MPGCSPLRLSRGLTPGENSAVNIAREIRKATVNVGVYGSPWVHNRVYPEGETSGMEKREPQGHPSLQDDSRVVEGGRKFL